MVEPEVVDHDDVFRPGLQQQQSGSEWRSKYDRLMDAHRRLQKTNQGLEEKLLRIVDKFEGDKNQLSRDLALQTQKLVESKLTVQQLLDQNRDLQSDLRLSINLLRNNRPSHFAGRKLDSLPPDIRQRVVSDSAGSGGDVLHHQHQHLQQQQLQPSLLAVGPSSGVKIQVAVPSSSVSTSCAGTGTLQVVDQGDHFFGPDDGEVSAAILAKVLEERDKERRNDSKFRIDVGTQTTHGWHFPPGSTTSCCCCSSSGHVLDHGRQGQHHHHQHHQHQHQEPHRCREQQRPLSTTAAAADPVQSRNSSSDSFSDSQGGSMSSRSSSSSSSSPKGTTTKVPEPRMSSGSVRRGHPIVMTRHGASSAITMTSVIQPPPPIGAASLLSSNSLDETPPMTSSSSTAALPGEAKPLAAVKTSLSALSFPAYTASPFLCKSATFSSMQTDI